MSSSVDRDTIDYVGDILRAATLALEFVDGMDREQFRNDIKTSYAVVRALEIVDEASKHIPRDVHDAYPDVPWSSMARKRDRLLHGYVQVNLDVDWEALQNDLPDLIIAVRNVLDAMRSAES